MNRHTWEPLLLSAAAMVLLVSCGGAFLPSVESAHGGVITFGHTTKTAVAIRGSWKYYPSRLLYPVDFEQQTGAEPIARATLPVGASEGGYATYRLQILDFPSGGYGGILVPSLGSAMELWVDGEKVGSAGQVGTSRSEEIAEPAGIVAFFPRAGSSADVVLQVSDFHGTAAERVSLPVLFGTAQAVASYESTVRGLQLALAVVLALFTLLFLLRYLTRGRREELRPLLIAAVCVAGLVRLITVYGLPGLPMPSPLTGGLPWPLDLRSGLASYFLLFVSYHLSFLGVGGRRLDRISTRIFLAVGGAAFFAAFFVPTSFVTPFAVGVGAFLSLGLAALALRALGLGGTVGTVGSRGLTVAGAVVLLIAAVNGVLVHAGISNVGQVAPLAVFVFAIIGAIEGEGVRLGSGTGGRSDRRLAPREIELFTEDIGRPLHGIVGLAESLLAGHTEELEADQVASLSLIAASGLRASNVVGDLADRERLKRNALRLERSPLVIELVLERVVEQLSPLMLVRSVEIRNELPGDLPPIDGDGVRVARILYNFMAEGIRRLEHGMIIVTGSVDGRMVEITVRGQEGSQGPEAEEAPRTEAADRLGDEEFSRLGLEVAVQLIRLHGGRVLERPSGAGRSFAVTFTLPVAAVGEKTDEETSEELIRLDDLRSSETEVAAQTEGRAQEGLKVLIAATDLVALQTMRNHLVKEHFRVAVAFDGEETLRQIENSPPDMLLVDAALSKINGFEVCRTLRKTHTSSELPVLILVDKAQSARLEEGLSAGASDFISKPMVPDEFLARVKTHINLAKMNTLYSRFVPVELLHFLGRENVLDLQLGDQIQREMTILFVDIRAFTNLSEGMTPEENFKFINSYLSRITPIIRENNGFVDKYIGDAILALYPGSPEDAIRSAIRMVDYLQEYNGYRRNSGYRPINIGIGIHTGNLIAGIIGDSARMQGTVISDAVNLASRVQDVTKLYGANIIISQDTFVRLENPTAYDFRFLGRVKVKGKNQTVSLFEIFDGEPPEYIALKNRTKQEFEDAILLFSQRKFQQASNAFRKIATENPVDRAAALFLNRSELFVRREKANWLLK